jgi:hypothetical protein
MRTRNHSLSAWSLASLLCLGAVSWSPPASAHPAPTVQTALRVNGVTTACGATVAPGDQVCLLFSSNQAGNAVVSIRRGTGTPTVLAQGAVKAGVNYRVCVTAGAADGVVRHFTVTVTNAEGLATSQVCSYAVSDTAGQAAPVVTTGLRVNGVNAACGATVAAGDQVCLLLSSNQSGTAVVSIQKGTGAETVLAQGSVQAGVTYRVCVTAGAADGIARTFTVKVTNASKQTTTATCAYIVGTAGQALPVVTTSLRVNGVAAACGATVASGAEVCVLLSSNQAGNAVVSIQKGTGAPTVLARGAVEAGRTYRVCVTAGAADSITRTFTVAVTNAAGQTGSQTCSYVVK